MNRRGVSEIIGSVFLVSFVIAVSVTFASFYYETNYNILKCDIGLLEINDIGIDNYWAEMILINNGDYPFNATLKYFDSVTINNFESNGMSDILPKEKRNVSFRITNITDNSIQIGFDIVTDDQSSYCMREVSV